MRCELECLASMGLCKVGGTSTAIPVAIILTSSWGALTNLRKLNHHLKVLIHHFTHPPGTWNWQH